MSDNDPRKNMQPGDTFIGLYSRDTYEFIRYDKYTYDIVCKRLISKDGNLPIGKVTMLGLHVATCIQSRNIDTEEKLSALLEYIAMKPNDPRLNMKPGDELLEGLQ